MSEGTTGFKPVADVNLKAADNGFILSWSKYEEAQGENIYDGKKWCGDGKKVFGMKESAKAMEEFIALCKQSGYLLDGDDTEAAAPAE